MNTPVDFNPSSQSVIQTGIDCFTKSSMLCVIQEGRLAQRTSTGWCTRTISVRSWRTSFSTTVTSQWGGRLSCPWHWVSLSDRWEYWRYTFEKVCRREIVSICAYSVFVWLSPTCPNCHILSGSDSEQRGFICVQDENPRRQMILRFKIKELNHNTAFQSTWVVKVWIHHEF